MRKLLLLVLAGCASNYLPTFAVSPGSDEALFSTAVYQTVSGDSPAVWAQNSLELWNRLGKKGDWFFHSGLIASFWYPPFPVPMPAVLGFGKAWAYQDGYAFVGVDALVVNVEEMLVPYAGASFKNSWGRFWSVLRPGQLGSRDSSVGFWPDVAAQAGFTFGKEKGLGLFAGAGAKDEETLWRAGFYLFEAIR